MFIIELDMYTLSDNFIVSVRVVFIKKKSGNLLNSPRTDKKKN